MTNIDTPSFIMFTGRAAFERICADRNLGTFEADIPEDDSDNTDIIPVMFAIDDDGWFHGACVIDCEKAMITKPNIVYRTPMSLIIDVEAEYKAQPLHMKGFS